MATFFGGHVMKREELEQLMTTANDSRKAQLGKTARKEVIWIIKEAGCRTSDTCTESN